MKASICLVTFALIGCLQAADISAHDQRIRELISRLAISEERAAMRPIDTPSKDAPKTDKRVIAYEAAAELGKLGTRAFPALLASLADHRQSVAFRAVIPQDVGFACFCILAGSVEDYPYKYGYGIRTGADGKSHDRPRLLTTENVRDWSRSRSSRALRELQLEAVEWQIAEEKRIRFVTAEQEAKFLGPLVKRRDELKSNQ